MIRRRVAAAALFAVIVGALTPSYLHLSDWWRPMMPVKWQGLSYVAALVTEATIVACGWILATMGAALSDDGRRTATRLEMAGVVAAVYVNARWAALRPDAPPLSVDVASAFATLDIVAGAAMLPVVAATAFRLLGHILATGDAAPLSVPAVAVTATAEVADMPPIEPPPTASRPARAIAVRASGRMAEDVRVAAAWGVSPRTAREWRRVGDVRYTMAPGARAT